MSVTDPEKRSLMMATLSRFISPGEICFSNRAISRLSLLEAKKAVFVTGSSLATADFIERAVRTIEKASIETHKIVLPVGDPCFEEAERISSEFRAFGPDWIIAIGGGRVLDTVKVAWALSSGHEIDLHPRRPYRFQNLRNVSQLAAIPTTAGSGSESSSAAVLSTAEGAKTALISQDWIPDLVILDPSATVGTPALETTQFAFDALAHAFESYASRLSNVFVRTQSAAAARLIIEALAKVTGEPNNTTHREKLSCGAYLAGQTQSLASTGLVHAMSHALSSLFGLSHAEATALCLIPGMRRNTAAQPELYDALARGVGHSEMDELFTTMETFRTSASMRGSLNHILGRQIDSSDLLHLADRAAVDVCLKTNPVKFTRDEICSIFETMT